MESETDGREEDGERLDEEDGRNCRRMRRQLERERKREGGRDRHSHSYSESE